MWTFVFVTSMGHFFWVPRPRCDCLLWHLRTQNVTDQKRVDKLSVHRDHNDGSFHSNLTQNDELHLWEFNKQFCREMLFFFFRSRLNYISVDFRVEIFLNYSLNIKMTAYGISALGCIGVSITSVVAVKWKEIFLRLSKKKKFCVTDFQKQNCGFLFSLLDLRSIYFRNILKMSQFLTSIYSYKIYSYRKKKNSIIVIFHTLSSCLKSFTLTHRIAACWPS